MEGIDQARRQRPLQGESAVHTGSALFQHGGGKGLGIVQGRQAQALAGRPFIDGEQGVDISRRRHDGLAFQFCSQTAGDGIGTADMTGQDGDDELPLLVDDQDGRVQVFMADKGRNSADGNACGADEDDQPGRFKSPGRFIVEIGCKRQDPFLDDGEFLQRRLADVPAASPQAGSDAAAQGRPGLGKGQDDGFHGSVS